MLCLLFILWVNSELCCRLTFPLTFTKCNFNSYCHKTHYPTVSDQSLRISCVNLSTSKYYAWCSVSSSQFHWIMVIKRWTQACWYILVLLKNVDFPKIDLHTLLQCIKYSTSSQTPSSYFYVILSMLCSIGCFKNTGHQLKPKWKTSGHDSIRFAGQLCKKRELKVKSGTQRRWWEA